MKKNVSLLAAFLVVSTILILWSVRSSSAVAAGEKPEARWKADLELPGGGTIEIPPVPDDQRWARSRGDYQDIWWWSYNDGPNQSADPRFHSAFTGGVDQGNIYTSAIR